MLPNMMRATILSFAFFTMFATIGAVPQRLRPQCRSKNVCDDRPQCPISSCNCLFPSGMDCAIYYQCINGKPYQYKCSPGLLFNEDTLSCDYSYNVNCSIGTTTSTTVTRTDQPETTKHISTKTTEKSTTTDTPKEPTTTTEKIITIPTTKPTTTTKETEKPPTVKTTEEPTTTKITEEPQTSRITTEEIFTIKTTEEPTTTSRGGTTSVKTTEEPTTTAVTEESHSTRITDEPITTKIPTTAEETTLKTTERPTTMTDEPITSKNTDGFSTAKTIQPTTVETASPNSTTSEIQTISTTTDSSSDFLCPTRFGLFPDPENCFRFYHCSHWIPYHKWCPSNLHFNPDLKVCDWPYRAGCALSTTVVFSTPTSTLPEEPTTKNITEDITTTKISVYTSAKTTSGPTTIKTTEMPTTTKVTEMSIVSETTKESTTEVTSFTTTVQPTSTETTERSTTPKTTAELTTVETVKPTTTTTSENPTTTEKYATTKTTEEPTTTKTPLPTTRETTKEPSTPKTTESVSTETEKPTTTETTVPTPAKITRNTTTTETTQGTSTLKTTAEPSTVKTTQELSTAKTTVEPTTINSSTESTAVSTETSNSKTTMESTTSKKTTERLLTTEEANTGTTTKVPSTTKLTETTPSSEIQTVSTINPSFEFQCPTRFGLFPDPKSCFRFYHCSHWIPHHKWCPSNLHFNPKLKVCDWPYRAGCDTILPTPSEPDNPVTSNPNDTYGTCDCDCCELPVPGDCNAYMLCINKVAFVMRCSPGLYFNPMTGTCDYKENVECPGDDVTCPEQTGRYLLPGSCSYFIECHGRKKNIRKCPEGLQFNQSSEMCSWLGSCTDQQPDSDAASKTITDNAICDGCDYCFKPFEEDCSSYARCHRNVATVEHCTPGLFFNPDTEMCDHDYNVECPEPQPPPVCPQTFGYFPYPGECGMYLKCVNGSAIVKHCPGILHFDPVRKHCDFPWTAGCSDSDSLPTPAPTGGYVQCDCDCCLKPVGTDCGSFVVCISGVGLVGSCSSGLLFNPESENCDFAENVNCPITPEIPEYICHDHQGLFPHPEDCHKFIHCAHGFPYVKDCPSNLHFNPKLKVCDWPYSAGCQDPQPTDPPMEDDEFPCEVCDSCFIRNEVDCAVYIYCLNGKGRKFRCADNLLFNPETESCDLATNVQCRNQPPSECLKPEGLFPATDCSQFIQCSNGIAYLKDCPNGLVFNPLFLVCDWPGNVKCGEIPVLPTPPDDSSDTSDTSNITCNCDCCFLPYSKDCSKYILCLDGHAHIGQCSRGLLFNPETQNCDVAERVTCGQKPPLCPEPNGLFPTQGHCSSYLKCTGGTAEIEYCQSGTHYSIDMQQCTDPCKAKCDSSYDCSTKPEDVSTSPSPSPSICLEPDGFYPVTGGCSSFYVCSNGQPERVMCPNGLHFNAEYEICEDPCDSQCDQTLDCVSPSPETSPAPTPIPYDPRCHQGNGLYPDEDDCSSFWHCSNGKSYHKKCLSGLHFSPIKQSCLRPCDAKCNSTIDCVSPSPETSPATTPIPSDPRCHQGNGLYPDEDDCSSFWHCSHGKSHHKKCPSGLHFSPIKQSCLFPCDAKCDSTIDCPGPKPKTTPATTPLPLDPRCLRKNGLYPDKDNCSSFLHCSNGIAHPKRCPAGLHFSNTTKNCENPCVAKCNTSIDCSSTTPKPISTVSPNCPTSDGIYPVSGDCTSFYICSNGKDYLISCPPGLHYSPKDEICEDPCVAQCNTSLNCNTTPKPDISSTTPHPISPECLKSDGRFPNPKDCGSYYQCSSGESSLIFCPSGLHFSKDDSECRQPCVAGCDQDIDCPPELPDPKGNCTCELCFLPDPSDCSALYRCKNGKLTKMYCGIGKLFSKKSRKCEDEENVECEARGDPSMCPEPFGIFPYPGNCSKFVHCEDGIANIQQCREGLKYDPQSRECTKSSEFCGDPVQDPNCPKPTGLFPDPTNCSLFFQCEHGVAYHKRCPPPLTFNPNQEVCDWPKDVACGNNTRDASTTSPNPFSSTPSSPSPSPTSPACYEVPGVICPCACRVPSYDECSSYYQCQEDGTACKRFCPEGLYFNKVEMICDLPENVECRDFFFSSLQRAKRLGRLLSFSTTSSLNI